MLSAVIYASSCFRRLTSPKNEGWRPRHQVDDTPLELELHSPPQNGRIFWLKDTVLGQLRIGSFQRMALWLRKKYEMGAVPL